MKLGLLLLIGVLAVARPSEKYFVHQRVQTSDGSLEILEDARLTPEIEPKLWDGCSQPIMVFDDSDPAISVFVGRPVLPARLRQRDPRGKVLEDILLEPQATVARIKPHRLGSANAPVIVIETSDAACFGSYSGWTEWLFRLDGNHVVPVVATAANGARKQVSLFRSLKSDWKFIQRTPQSIEIEQVFCRPDLAHATRDKMPFLMRYITYRFDGHHWREFERTEPGLWENDEQFPPEAKFPRDG
ncbi:MAG TPA: hypothetical protein VGG69_02700 [Rhizomicrobium sp.]|jgi:hypothetical protein